ncbi:MAG: hypothetical protein M3451_08965 [Chloroflexota bacterium]|nr:hypothetical protein [Chloroflexota bacterium]
MPRRHVLQSQAKLVIRPDAELPDIQVAEAEVADAVVGGAGRPAPAVVCEGIGQGGRSIGVDAQQVEGVAVAVPADQVGAGIGLATGTMSLLIVPASSVTKERTTTSLTRSSTTASFW